VPSLTAGAAASYLWGEDRTVDEPALGVAPPGLDLSLRWSGREKRFVETIAHMVGDQNRVASTRGELPTAGYTTFDLRAGVRLLATFDLRGGVLNIADREYINHLNAKNPFTAAQLPEPGRVFFLDFGYAF
jgi:iron complex outermembrane receptor protein